MGGPVGCVPLGGISDQAEILFVLSGQMEPLAGLCNHLWLGKIPRCVPWQSGVTGWSPQLGRAMGKTPQSFLFGWGIRLCPNWMVLLAGLCVQVGL